jgi:hypothetical protein
LRECNPDENSIANACKCEKQYAVKENMMDRSRVETGRHTALATLVHARPRNAGASHLQQYFGYISSGP